MKWKKARVKLAILHCPHSSFERQKHLCPPLFKAAVHSNTHHSTMSYITNSHLELYQFVWEKNYLSPAIFSQEKETELESEAVHSPISMRTCMVFNSGLLTVNPVIMYIVYSSKNGHLKMAKKNKKQKKKVQILHSVLAQNYWLSMGQ